MHHPAFAVVNPWLEGETLPTIEHLNAIVARTPSLMPSAADEIPLRFERAPAGQKPKALEYERAIHKTGRVPLRDNDWHDAFNALCWIAWPSLKREINAIHAAYPGAHEARRGPVRDAMTLIDESGIVVLCSDPDLSDLMTGKCWKSLFIDCRDHVAERMRFLVCGHALLDKLRAPYPSITGRALIVPAAREILAGNIGQQRRYADRAASAQIATRVTSPAATVAVPIAGVPGWAPGNDRAEFYDDFEVFRSAGPMA